VNRSLFAALALITMVAVEKPGFSEEAGLLPAREQSATLAATAGTPYDGAGEESTRYILFLGSARPWIAEVQMHVAGRAHREKWEAWVAQRFEQLDANADGHLDGGELGKIVKEKSPTPSSALFNFFNKGGSKAALTGDTDDDGTISPEELAAHYRAEGQGSFRVEANNESYDALRGSQNLSAVLDLDGDEGLSAAELDDAIDSTAKLDRDEDELLGTNELMVQQQGFQVYGGNASDEYVAHEEILDLPTDDAELAKLVRTIQDRYRKPSSKKPGLARWELKWSNAKVFERFDADASGRIEDAELIEFLRHPVCDLRITVRFESRRWWTTPPKDAPPTWVVEPNDEGTQQPPVKVFKIFGNRRRIVTGGDSLELLPPQSLQQNERNLVSNYTSQFEFADQDKNDYLDAREAQQYYIFNGLFEELDANGDEKVFLPELRTFLDARLGAARSRTRLVVADRGRNLFDLMDGNRNGTITPRELVTGKGRALGWDADEDGKLTDAEIPRFFRLAFRPGKPSIQNSQYFGGEESLSSPTGQGRSNLPGAPAWFPGMDRNRDGDVSRREFLGPIADFDRLDADGDGLVSVEEAKEVPVTTAVSAATSDVTDVDGASAEGSERGE
jgi:Ca2+-binding EF-hand superfamily protein